MRDLLAMLDRKKTVLVTILATLLFLRNPMTIVSLLIYIGLGLFLQPILSQILLKRKFPFMVIFFRDLVLVIATLIFFQSKLVFMDVMMVILFENQIQTTSVVALPYSSTACGQLPQFCSLIFIEYKFSRKIGTKEKVFGIIRVCTQK